MTTSAFMKCVSILAILASSSTNEEPPPAAVVKLQRTSVILPKSAERAGKRKNFYSAKLSVGKPQQEFNVFFDLEGGTMVLPAEGCTDSACLERHRYNKWLSDRAEDIQADGRLVQPKVRKTLLRRRDRGTLGVDSIDVGSGKVVGNFVRDEVCVAEGRCFPLAFLAADKMSDMPFLTEPYDGAVGLALKGMSLSLEFNFLAAFVNGHYRSTMIRNSFGLHIGSEQDGGELTLGGYDVDRLSHPLKWASVVDPQEGRWQIAVSAIRIGNATLDVCSNQKCRAALDYSSSLLGVPTSLLDGIQSSLAKLTPPQGFGDGCQMLAMPEISLQLTNDFTITLPAEDYVSDFGVRKSLISKPSCEPVLAHHHADENLGKDVFILGESVMRRYYTFFDADALRVGFSLAGAQAKLAAGEAGSSEDAIDKDQKGGASTTQTQTIFLVQVKIVSSKTLSPANL
jgi:hypothetical protein